VRKRPQFPPREILGDPIHCLAFGLGSGLAPVAPGTFGTLAAIPLYLAASGLSLPLYGLLVAALFLAGIHITGRSAERLGAADPSGIVFDEIVGYLVTMAAVPFSWPAAALGFLLFRLFDILKPWPVGPLDRRVHGGLGIMLDDAVAGLLAAACLHGSLPYLQKSWLG
jgi:phosphatidylglycerophosphatase A